MLRSFVAAVAAALLLASAALADVPSFEAKAAEVASGIAGRPVRIVCYADAASWAARLAELGIASQARGVALWTTPAQPGDEADLSPSTCAEGAAFLAMPNPTCQTGSRTVYRWRWIRRHGKRVHVRRKVDLPTYGPCVPRDEVDAVWTLTHEATHLTGLHDEAVVQCYGMQRIYSAGQGLGASVATSRSMARAAWGLYVSEWYRTIYWSPDCFDGGPLDLSPGDGVWP